MHKELFMRRCLQLAELGLGKTAPNPMVGCVIVHDLKIIGEGYHENFGSHHAEVNAINSVKDKKLLQKSALYVTLEPCSHFGKTPPCTDLIIKHKIPEVIVGIKDSFKKVNGSGIKKLKDAGVNVIAGVLKNECKEINRRFFSFHEKKRPYIILKWAQNHSGYIAPINKNSEEAFMISNEFSQKLVHKWRSEEPAILVGTNTAENDNPKLNVRLWSGKNPLRLVIDRELKLAASLNLFDKKIKTVVFSNKKRKDSQNISYIKIDLSLFPEKQMMDFLFENNIQSVIVEGGAKLMSSFIKKNLWDEVRIITCDKPFNPGVKAPEFAANCIASATIQNDTLRYYRNF